MTENNNSNKNENIVEELNKIKKRQKLLKLLTIFLSFIVFISFIGFAIIYYQYKKIQNSFEIIIQNSQTQQKLEDLTSQFSNVISTQHTLSQNQQSSLSMIGFSKDMITSVNDKETQKNIEELTDEYMNDEDIKKFIENINDDPELKTLFDHKNTPLNLYKKMQDPKFMQKMMNKFMNNPKLFQTMIKMVTDPKMQNIMKNMPDEIKKINISSQTLKSP